MTRNTKVEIRVMSDKQVNRLLTTQETIATALVNLRTVLDRINESVFIIAESMSEELKEKGHDQ